jgi:hypothetical protein
MFLRQFTNLTSAAFLLGLVCDLFSKEVKNIAEHEIEFSKAGHFRTFHPRRSKACPSCDLRRSKNNHQRRSSQTYIESKFPDSNETQIVDLMVVYESSVINLAGGTDKLKTVISNALEDTNKCFSNSLIPLRVRLVHSREVFYSLVGYHKDLDRLSIPDDGYLDSAYTYRDKYGADIVCMLSSIVGSTGGLGDTLRNSDAAMSADEIHKFGFNINLWSEMGAPEYTLAHEIGHALGCVHNREAEVGNNDMILPYAFGKRWFSEGQGVRSVMAYDDDNADTYPTTVPYFSNPAVPYLSELTGNINSEDNAQVIRRTSPFVSSLRPTKVQGIHPSQFELNLEEGVLQKISVKLMMDPNGKKEVFISFTGTNNISTTSSPFVSFDSSNWNVPQEVTLLGTNVDQNHTAQLTFSLAGMELDTDIPIKISTSSKPDLTGWIWLENFPWAYTHDEEDWLYFSSGTGKWMYYENADKIWSEINSQNYPVGWLWFNHYPWVYSSTKKGWFYFKASTGQLIYYSNQEKVWRVLEYRK